MRSTASPGDPPRAGRPKRPVGIRILVALGLLQGLVLALGGALVVAAHDDPQLARDLEADPEVVLIAGLVLVGLGLVHLVLALGLRRGSHLVRSLYTLAATFQTASAVYGLAALRDIRTASVWSFASGALVLWFLYGSERTEEFFAR